MKGFDAKSGSFPECIIRVTRELWDDHHAAKLPEDDASEINVRAPAPVADLPFAKAFLGATFFEALFYLSLAE